MIPKLLRTERLGSTLLLVPFDLDEAEEFREGFMRDCSNLGEIRLGAI